MSYKDRGDFPRRAGWTGQESDREVRQSRTHSAPAAFGIGRPLNEDSQVEIQNVTQGMQKAGLITENIVLREELSITLLSQRLLDSQLSRGNTVRHNLLGVGEMVDESEECSDRGEPLQYLVLGDVQIADGRVYVDVCDTSIDREIKGIQGVLGELGVVGNGRARRKSHFIPHVTLGDVRPGYTLPVDRQQEIVRTLDMRLPMSIDVEPWDVYPDDVFHIAQQRDGV